jgi:hypothetical protein
MSARNPAAAYVAPFAAYVAILGVSAHLPLPLGMAYPLRVGLVCLVLLVLSRKVVPRAANRLFASLLVGAAVFVVWIFPDLLWPGYRQHWLFENPLTGAARSSIPLEMRADAVFLVFRILGSVVVVPVIEELFWRGWLIRYLTNRSFEAVPIGTATRQAGWITALLFATEHGPYWEVGLLAGIAYNWWVGRTSSLGDCIVAHATTNACLAACVIYAGRWEYWM